MVSQAECLLSPQKGIKPSTAQQDSLSLLLCLAGPRAAGDEYSWAVSTWAALSERRPLFVGHEVVGFFSTSCYLDHGETQKGQMGIQIQCKVESSSLSIKNHSRFVTTLKGISLLPLILQPHSTLSYSHVIALRQISEQFQKSFPMAGDIGGAGLSTWSLCSEFIHTNITETDGSYWYGLYSWSTYSILFS